GYGLTITGRVALPTPETTHNVRYLRTKRERMGHQIDTTHRAAPVLERPVGGT
ncbi:MAG: bifunctional 3,4-dihydroxy-2-butanone 4-phosphate synthase/GTP cyclohydrolase protein, partial [Klenkia sp.]|nr:bifunctional 3,4-dihydroxy-2-butanone 4-phosphate synthase/GTP cyclohydrolase protein [Klenkia sp.]